MDLLLILGGMFVGAFAGLCSAAGFNASPEVRFTLSISGAVLGCAAGYLIAWRRKTVERLTRRPQTQPKRTFSRQVVGGRCAECDERILFIADAHICPDCQRILCKRCAPELPCGECEALAKLVEPEIIDAEIVAAETSEAVDNDTIASSDGLRHAATSDDTPFVADLADADAREAQPPKNRS